MSLTFERGGFHASKRTATLPHSSGGSTIPYQSERNDLLIHLMTQLYCLIDASKKDCTARGAAYTCYWEFDTRFLNACAESSHGMTGTQTYSMVDGMDADAQLVRDLYILTGKDRSEPIAIRANDFDGIPPAIATALIGQNGERLYIAFCLGSKVITNSTAGSSIGVDCGLTIVSPWAKGGTDATAGTPGGGFHVWYKPFPTEDTIEYLPYGFAHPCRQNATFLTHPDEWCMDCGFALLMASRPQTSNPNLISSASFDHVVACKEGDILFGLSRESRRKYDWMVLGRAIVEKLDGTGAAGAFALQETASDATANDTHLGFDSLSDAAPSDMLLQGVSSHAGYVGQSTQKAVRFRLIAMGLCMSNRLSVQPVAFVPITVHAISVATEAQISAATMLGGDGNSLVGFLRGDIARSTFGWGLTENQTIDNGNYIVTKGAGSGTYHPTSNDYMMRLVVGWDSSNEVTL